MAEEGHQSLLGAVYVIEYQTGKVLGYYSLLQILSQLQLALEGNKDIADFLAWKKSHESKCESNFDGSSGSMEPVGLVKIFKCSLN